MLDKERRDLITTIQGLTAGNPNGFMFNNDFVEYCELNNEQLRSCRNELILDCYSEQDNLKLSEAVEEVETNLVPEEAQERIDQAVTDINEDIAKALNKAIKQHGLTEEDLLGGKCRRVVKPDGTVVFTYNDTTLIEARPLDYKVSHEDGIGKLTRRILIF